ncbi:MAG: hypothetical protein ACLGG8_04400 [Gammaproteobacteria bacterium]
MSILTWIRSRNKAGNNRDGAAGKGRRGFSRTTLPLISPRRGRRILRREQLFAIVRESMIRGGVLSTSYEFKVLALDSNADSFLVLIELALPADVVPDEYLLEIERWVQTSARSRLAMDVPSVYWRRKPAPDQKGMALKASVAAQTRREAQMHADAVTALPPLRQSAPATRPHVVSDEEVAAFREALEQPPQPTRRHPGQAAGDARVPGPEPEMHSDFAALSETQYGKL